MVVVVVVVVPILSGGVETVLVRQTHDSSPVLSSGVLHIVMGYCEGGDLCSRLKTYRGQLLAEVQVVEWFVQITLALQASPPLLPSLFLLLFRLLLLLLLLDPLSPPPLQPPPPLPPLLQPPPPPPSSSPPPSHLFMNFVVLLFSIFMIAIFSIETSR